MSNSYWLLVIIAIIVIAIGGGWYISQSNSNVQPPITSTTTNNSNQNPTTTPSVQPVYKNASADRITVSSPKPGASVARTFVVTGQARGGWYFEASFPLEVVSATGTVLVQMPVQAQGDWMTPNFVPFSATTTLPTWYHGPATLVLKNDNPSGLPENEASISFPIIVQ